MTSSVARPSKQLVSTFFLLLRDNSYYSVLYCFAGCQSTNSMFILDRECPSLKHEEAK